MNFKKFKRKLSAVLCSAMMVGGSSVSNRVAMAGGIKLRTKLGDIIKYGKYEMDSGDNIKNKFEAGLDSEGVQRAKVTFDEGEGKEYEALMYKLALPRSKSGAEREVKLFLIPAVGGFGLSVKNANGEGKFGILPLSYLVYHLCDTFVNINNLNLSTPFKSMDEKLQKKLIVTVANILGGKINVSNKNALEFAYTTIDCVVPDENEPSVEAEEEDTRISSLCIRAFWDTKPKVGDTDLKVMEQQLANESQVVQVPGEQVLKEENESKNIPMITPTSEFEQFFMPPNELGKPIANKQKWSKRKHLAVWVPTAVAGLTAVTSPIWVKPIIANRRNRSLPQDGRAMNNIGVPVRPNNGGVKSNGVSKGTRLRSRGRGKLPLKGNRTGKVKG